MPKVQKWGNSQGLRLAKHRLDQARIRVGDEVDVKVKNGILMIRPSGPKRGKVRLKNLVDKMPANYSPEELDWGGPTGKEVW